ncbi:GNAT family N-acetyltransferase [Nocardia sp. CA-135953]|uniref:GNAT family N-acetyltransferase n=1 Tax=Nocardia sp. CA-135953 TaxID=3239978 RepID=UPI003D996D86
MRGVLELDSGGSPDNRRHDRCSADYQTAAALGDAPLFPGEAIERAERDLTATSGFVGSLAMIDGKPAGGASLRLSDGVAQLCGAATLPEFRRRGVQGARLSMRLAAAAAAGCDLAVVTTLPGSKSQQNVQKLGFQLLYPRAVLVR